MALERDAVGRVVAEREGGQVRRYRYDLGGQLRRFESPDGVWEWGYDDCGRLVSRSGPGGSEHFVYDSAGQLVSKTGGAGEVTYFSYDGLGRRVSEQGPDRSVVYRWDALGRLARVERTGGGKASTTRLRVGPLGDLQAVDGKELAFFPDGTMGQAPLRLGDQTVVGLRGMPVATVDDGGEVGWLSADWTGTTGGAGGNPWGPTAQHSSPEARLGYRGEIEFGALVWLRNRVYDPATQSFLSRDPLAGATASPGGLVNRYSYGGNDPVNNIDPTGLKPVTEAEANKQIQGWNHGHLGEIASAALAVGAVAMIATGVGAPIGAGILIGEGMSVGGQLLTKGKVNWDQVAISGAAGGVGGGAGMAADALTALAPAGGVLASSAVSGGISGAASGASSSVTDQLLTTGSVNPEQTLIDTASGGVGGAAADKLSGAVRSLRGGSSAGNTVYLHRSFTKDWNADQLGQFHQKVSDLQDLAKQGKLVKTEVDQGARPSTNELRRIYEQYRQDHPELNLPDRQPGQHMDHIHELQLGGSPDDGANIRPLDGSVNSSVGKQLDHELRRFDFGDPIHKVVLGSRPPSTAQIVGGTAGGNAQR